MQEKSKAVHVPEDWKRLMALTDELLPEFGPRSAFKAACKRLPECSSVPPDGAEVTQADSSEGVAKPWAEVLKELDIKTKSDGAPKPTSGALPWNEVFSRMGK